MAYMHRVRRLPTVVAAEPGRPERPGAAATRRSSADLASGTTRWSPAMARDVRSTYAKLAGSWDDERGSYRSTPLADALARGGLLPPGRCVEIGCGTGRLTPLLEQVWDEVIGLDLTPQMLSRSTGRWRLLADASRLPLSDGVAAAAVLADVPLFATEVVRILTSGGIVVWSNALGSGAPHHVPVEVVLDALDAATPGRPWHAVVSDAGWGSWALLRR